MRRLTILLILALVALVACEPTPGSITNTRLKLSAPNRSINATVYGSGNDAVTEVTPEIWVEALNSAFEVQVKRVAYNKPKTARAFLAKTWRNLPLELLDDWDGFLDAFKLRWFEADGSFISEQSKTWCPNNVPRKRVTSSSPKTSRYAIVCGTHPFSKGQRWGIEGGWAVQALGTDVNAPALKPGNKYSLEVELQPSVARFLAVPTDQRKFKFKVSAVQGREADLARSRSKSAQSIPATVHSTSSQSLGDAPAERSGPNTKALRKSDLPDLVALPPIGIGTHVEAGRDVLDFSATVWNAGSAPIVVDGYRRGSTFLMTGSQRFFRNNAEVGSVGVGDLMYDQRQSHLHWHLMDFATYELIDSAGRTVGATPSKGFCLAPTDAIDLLSPGAVADPGDTNLATACGDKDSKYVREVLPAGWGDTYTQVRAGQSIDVSNLPNGNYGLRVTANPASNLWELTTANNVATRQIVLSGVEGRRRVKAPPYQLIDSEAKFGPLPDDSPITPASQSRRYDQPPLRSNSGVWSQDRLICLLNHGPSLD